MLGRRIAKARRKANLNQTQLARLVGVKRQAVSKWEKRDGTHPTIANLQRIARVTKTPIAELLGGAV